MEARWGKSDTWFAATIAAVNGDGRFAVDWEDGNTHGRTKRAEDLRRKGMAGTSAAATVESPLADTITRGASVLSAAARTPTASLGSPGILSARGTSVAAAAAARQEAGADTSSLAAAAPAPRAVRASAAEAPALAAAVAPQPRPAEAARPSVAPGASANVAASPVSAAAAAPHVPAAVAAPAAAPAARSPTVGTAAGIAGTAAFTRLPAGACISPELPQEATPVAAPVELAPAEEMPADSEEAATEQPKPREDVKCFMVERADGSTCVVVQRSSDGKRWRFEKSSIEFELNCDAESLSNWLNGITNQQLPGLLTLMAAEVGERGAQLKAAEKERDALRGTEDYDFFGLDGEECTDKDIERAYRKKSTQLHPDKGGDEAAFDSMRKKYEQLKELRGEGKRKEGGGGAIKWDPNSRDSMLKAHSDLREQIVWITKHTRDVSKQVDDLQERQRVRRTLTWAPHSDSCRHDAASVGDTAYMGSNLQATSSC